MNRSSTIQRRIAIRRNPRNGATAVEMAMCMPILFLLLFGCYEFARANMMRHAVQAASYEGARTGIVPGATVRDVERSVQFVLSTVGVRNFDVVVSPNPIGLRSQKINVAVSLRMRDNTSLPMLFNNNTELSGVCELNREGGF
jgi:Flp pilus assembly protein TadG